MKHRHSLLLFCFIVMALAVLGLHSSASAQAGTRVGLVVQYLDGTIEKRCVELNPGENKGSDVLRQSGLAVQFEFNASVGSAVCKIGPDGCEADNCFCQMPNYWSYWHQALDDNNQWRWLYSPLGASNHLISSGQVEGWRYGAGLAPDELPRFDEICAPPTATPSATPSATLTRTPLPPAPQNTATPLPTHTSAPATQVESPSQVTANPGGSLTTLVVIYIAPTDTATPPVTRAASSTVAAPTPMPTATQPPTQTPPPTAKTASHTPPPSATQTAVVAGSTPTPPEAQIDPVTPTPTPTLKPRWGVKPSRTPSAAGPAQAQGQLSGAPTSQASTSSGAQVIAQAAPEQDAHGAGLGLLAPVAGGLAGMLAFFAFFGILSAALVAVLVWKRR